MVSMGIVIGIFSTQIGRVQIVPQYHPVFLSSMKIVFIIFAVFCFGGLFASIARGRFLKRERCLD